MNPMKGRGIIMPASLQQKALNQMYLNHTSLQKTGLLTIESICWNNDIKILFNNVLYALVLVNMAKGQTNHMRYQVNHGTPFELLFSH